MKRINILNDETANKIAAGEVVERPSSVVKELTENSIDAGAKNIIIEILEGGQKTIRIIDDGSGIHQDDVEKAFLPHATSKILNINDIFNITTLGFRGEALASIASVSNIKLRSKTETSNLGKEISISGGIINTLHDIGMNKGTVIEVEDLFYNVPARLKFLKSSVRESALISDIVSRLSLANPDISFKLLSNEKKLLHTYGNGNLLDCIRSIYGKTVCDNLTYFENHSDTTSIYGYIGNSEISRGSRNNQSIFVNKRYIKSKLITAAMENAFKSFLTINKYPFFIIFLDIFPEFIDVNIHPTKAEIKFREEREIFKLVFDGVHNAIRRDLKDSFDIPVQTEFVETVKYENISYFENTNIEDSTNKKVIVEIPIDLKNTDTERELTEKNILIKDSSSDLHCDSQGNNVVSESHSFEKTPKFPPLNIIGQFNKTYILAQSSGELYIIDQHAAHEKILFEKFKEEIHNKEIIVQGLITPAVLELSTEDFLYYVENKDVFENTGFVIDDFGNNTITIREVPYILGKLDIKNLFLSIIDNLKAMGSGKTVDIKYDAIAKLACKSAIKANYILSDIEISNLIEQLRFSEDPFNCPHGRPTIIKMSLNELEKRFKRVQ